MRGGIHLLSLVSPVPSLRCRIRKGSAAGVIWKRCLAAFDPKSCRNITQPSSNSKSSSSRACTVKEDERINEAKRSTSHEKNLIQT
ncbi:hypothetical protein OPV22_027106 [Ensete ventricosum]|uniref:Secreted protein n=1 Tax=Ensete ventricosum TaxID=4639 RepID=A0AAV8PZN1_ENSVE|nr:hypothetical protein OPV22_027106 [Ensete ventricosum]